MVNLTMKYSKKLLNVS